jgi:hypothetical protein
MRVQTNTNTVEDVSFLFDQYEVVVKFNPLLLEYDAEIFKISGRGKWLVTKTGGKTQSQASIHARQLILGKDTAELIDDLQY